MQSEVIKDLFNFIKAYHATQEVSRHGLDESRLNCELREYQKDAVRWMLSKELGSCPASSIQCQGRHVKLPSGGILADEMGLGKTVEVLACILSNPFPTDDIPLAVRCRFPSVKTPMVTNESRRRTTKSRQRLKTPPPPNESHDEPPEKKRKSGAINSPKYAYLRSWYEQSIGISKPQLPHSSTPEVTCFCSHEPASNESISCCRCGSTQHRECVNPNNSDYLCPWCWLKEEPVASGATFIICPPSILPQWSEEISRHVNDKNFKVLVYEGVKSKLYIQPTELASYDIVITSYTTLRTELNYSNDDNINYGLRLRHVKKFLSPVTPLTSVRWWRVCLDEAQMVEGRASAAAHMARKLSAVHRWAVTGTPIQKSVSDLFGLVEFLRIEPYCETKDWASLVEDYEECENFIASIMWRNSKRDVLMMLGVPPQTTQFHWLSFAPIEDYFYKKMKDECSEGFSARLEHIEDVNIPIKRFVKSYLNKLLNPLLKLRQACIHPQVVRGKFLKFKHTMKIEDLINDMSAKAKIDFSNALRQLVTAINGLAAVSIINGNLKEAVDLYRRVIGLSVEYKDICKVDTLQMIHTLHNLSTLLEQPIAGVGHTLRDSELMNEVKELESSYLKKHIDMWSKTKTKQAAMTNEIENMYKDKSNTLGYSDWWCRVINWADFMDLRTRIVTHLDNTHGATSSQQSRGMTISSKKLSSLPSIYNLLGVWLAEADKQRIVAIKGLANLDKMETEDLVSSAYRCHLKKTKNKKSEKCKVCIVEDHLLSYEKTIFSISEKTQRRKKRQNRGGFPSDDEESEFSVKPNKKNEKEIADLKQAEILSLKSEGNWNLTDQERILQILSTYAKIKKAPESWVKESVEHMALLELVRKEFKLLRDHWRHIYYTVAASDEVSMSKLRLRLPTEEELLDFEHIKKNRLEHIFIILPHEFQDQWMKLMSEEAIASDELKNTHGIYLYLERLRADGCAKNEPCPICREVLPPTSKWCVLYCAHRICLDCFTAMIPLNPQSEIECPLCRAKTPKQCVSYAVEEDASESDRLADASALAEAKMKMKGSYSTKVEAVTRTLLALIAEDPDVKVLVFSAWTKVLDVISEALLANNILFRKMETMKNGQVALQQFRTGSSISALLIPIHLGSKGLNIIEATHVFLVEPLLNPADELQAIGRVHRIGQTKPTFVHRFVINNTVEEKIINSLLPTVACPSSMLSEGGTESDAIATDENLTVKQLMDLFS